MMKQNIFSSGYFNHKKTKLLLPLCLVILQFFVAPLASAGYLTLKTGQSRTITVEGNIDTVFVSNPSVADYRVIGDKRLVVYAKTPGFSEVVAYDRDAKVLKKVSMDVDNVLGDLSYRIKQQFPDSNIRIQRVGMPSDSKDTTAYLLSGTAATEGDIDSIYRLVGSVVGRDDEKLMLETGGMTKSKNDSGGGGFEMVHMRRYLYGNVINKIELPVPNQINVQLTLIEVEKRFKDSLGISWQHGSPVNNVIGDIGSFTLVNFKGLDSSRIVNAINAVQNDDIAKVLAQPNLTVLSGENASFLVGGEFPVQTKENTSSGYHTTITYKQFGILLNIAAKVESRKKIKLFVSNELSSLNGTFGKNEYEIPQFKTRRSHSTIELADGDSFILGGLLSEEDRELLTKIPFIGDIPILGALARSTTTERSKTELLVFATVNLVKPAKGIANYPIPQMKKSSISKLFFNVGVNKAAVEGRLGNDTYLNIQAKDFLDNSGFAK